MTDGGPDQEQNGQDNVEARKEAATTALQSLAPYDRQEIMGQIVSPTQEVTDRQAQWMSGAGAVLISGGLVLAGFVVFRSDTPSIWNEVPTGGTISETVSFYLPLYFVPILQITATALILIIGYLLTRAGYAASSEFIPEKDRVMVSEILGRTDPKEAIDQYVRLRSLTGISGFFTKMKLSGLPLATITLTLIFTVLAIWAEPFFDLAKLALGVFLGSYIQQNAGPERQP